MIDFDHNNWRESSKKKEINANKLSEKILPGSRIFIGSACSEPLILTNELAKPEFQQKIRDCQILHFFSLSQHRLYDEDYPTRFRHNTLSIIGSSQMREAVNMGKADYTPIRSAEIPALLKNKRYLVDVALIQVSPPDKNGWCSLGINVDINRAIVKVAKTIIAQINPKMPVTMGDSFIKFNDIHYYVYEENELIQYETPQPDENSQKIAEYISRLIEDGSTLNLGLGKIPSLLPYYLIHKKNLAIFSEFIHESLMELIRKEVISCSNNIHPHCMTSFAIGTSTFYEFLDNNPFIEFHPTDFITDIHNISLNDKMCSVYSAMSVDLIGQVTNDLRSSLYRGIGGEADFMRGSALSNGGKCIIALPSVTDEGRSRILPMLTTEPVAVPSFDVHYVVTEYGIAHIHGKSLRERILQMIGVAHPKYRQWLLDSAKKFHYIYQDQKLPSTEDGVVVIYPEIEWDYKTKEGEIVHFRPVKPTDERMMQDLYYSLSDLDRIMRFFRPHKYFSHEETQKQIICDYEKSLVLVGLVGNEDQGQTVVSVGAYYVSDNNFADVSFTVHDEYRNQGLGTHVFEKIIELAQQRGFKGISGDVLINNEGMIKILKSSQFNVKFKPEGDSLEFEFSFDDKKKTNLEEI